MGSPQTFGSLSLAKKQDKLNRVPPYLPIVWQDWASSLDMQQMTFADEGFFFRFLRKQWELGELPADPYRLAKLLHCHSTTASRWLHKWCRLVTPVQHPCTTHAPVVDHQCSMCVTTVHNKKLQNLKIDVISGIELGTTEQNRTEQNRTEPEPSLSSSDNSRTHEEEKPFRLDDEDNI